MATPQKTKPFHEFWLSLCKEDRAELARRCDSTVGYLTLVASRSGGTRASANVALLIEAHTNRVCRVEEISPHIRWDILLSRPGLRRKAKSK